MIIANDINKKRIFVDDAIQTEKYFCQICGGIVIPKRGLKRTHHYAHKSVADCKYMRLYHDNAMTEWHKRMQSYFPIESREVRFRNQHTEELHIADVYLDKIATVIEFQHSAISTEEFRSRTEFHLKEKRRVVWVFDESTNPEQNIKLHPKDKSFLYSWADPRRCLEGINLFPMLGYFSVCVYTGNKDNEVCRILGYDKVDEIMLSPNPVIMSNSMDANCFFTCGIDFLNNLMRIGKSQVQTSQIIFPIRSVGNATYNASRYPLEQSLHKAKPYNKSFKKKSYSKQQRKKSGK